MYIYRREKAGVAARKGNRANFMNLVSACGSKARRLSLSRFVPLAGFVQCFRAMEIRSAVEFMYWVEVLGLAARR